MRILTESLQLFLSVTLAKRLVADIIQNKFHIKVFCSCVGCLKNGMKCLKCGSLPVKADTEKQKNFPPTSLMSKMWLRQQTQECEARILRMNKVDWMLFRAFNRTCGKFLECYRFHH